MKPATQKRIVRALRDRIEGVLGKIAGDERAAKREISSLFGSPHLFTNKRPTDVAMHRGFRAGVALGLWSEMEKDLKDKPEPTKDELESFIKQIKSADLDFMLRSFLRRMMRKLPPFPPGKKRKFDSQQQKEIVSEVRRLTNVTGSRKKVYADVAKKRGVHWRTIQNLCLQGKGKDNLEAQTYEATRHFRKNAWLGRMVDPLRGRPGALASRKSRHKRHSSRSVPQAQTGSPRRAQVAGEASNRCSADFQAIFKAFSASHRSPIC
jgi:hypothetical protein